MQPLANYVLLGEVKEDLKTESGIILTKSVTTGNTPGKIIARGAEANTVLKVGQHVVCDWKQATPVMVENKQCVLLKDEFIMAVSQDV